MEKSSELLLTNAIIGIPYNERRNLVAKLAYQLSEKRGFNPAYDVENWLNAESEVYSTQGSKDF